MNHIYIHRENVISLLRQATGETFEVAPARQGQIEFVHQGKGHYMVNYAGVQVTLIKPVEYNTIRTLIMDLIAKMGIPMN